MTETSVHLPLLFAFRALVQSGAPLGIRDYLDVLRALRGGFGRRPAPTRAAVLNLCSILWCRSDEERRLLESIFGAIPRAEEAEIRTFRQWLDGVPHLDPTMATDMPRSPSRTPDLVAAPESRQRVSVTSPDQQEGIALPSIRIAPADRIETFVLKPEMFFSQRELAIIWWRLRRLERGGRGTEIDFDQSIQSLCKRGALDRPILRVGRRNTLSILILVDVSSSMAPWAGFISNLEASLPLSRLKRAEIFYFDEVPYESVYEQRNLRSPVALEDLVDQWSGAPLMVVSDAGAAKHQMSRVRLREMRSFLTKVTPALRPVVWINPMPHSRWRGTTAGALARRELRATFFPLERGAFFRAIDVLRGARAA
jgi:uncharacterized protein